MTRGVLAYLGILEDGSFELAISLTPLNPVGSRLEKGKAFPDVVRACMTDPRDPQKAIAGLRGLANYFGGLEHGVTRPEFGVPVTAKRRRKK